MEQRLPEHVPLTWGQQMYWWYSTNRPPAERHLSNIVSVWHLPEPTTLDGVRTALDILVDRHVALRTSYPTDAAGLPFQAAVAGHRLAVRDREVPEGVLPDDLARSVAREVKELSFDLEAEVPVRVVALSVEGRAVAVVFCAHHIALDFAGFELLREEFTGLLAGGEPVAPGPGQHGTLDPHGLALRERSDAGEVQNAKALAYWREQLHAVPARLFPRIVDAWTAADTYACTLASRAVRITQGQVAPRLGVSEPAVLLAAFGVVLARESRSRLIPVGIQASNRLGAELRSFVGTLTQKAFFCLDLRDDPGFADVARRTHGANLRALRHARYDHFANLALLHEVSTDRGIHLRRGQGYFVDFNYNPRTEPCDTDLIEGGTGAAALRAHQAGATDLRWESAVLEGEITLHVTVRARETVLRVIADDAAVPRRAAERILLGIEALLLDVACGADPPLSTFPSAQAASPSTVDNCQVDTGATEEALRSVPGVRKASVRAPRGAEPAGLHADVALASWADPDEVRRHLLDVLAFFPGAMVPRHWATTTVREHLRAPEPEARAHDALLRAFAELHPLNPPRPDADYIENNGRIPSAPALVTDIHRAGWTGVTVDDLMGHASLRMLARRLVPASA